MDKTAGAYYDFSKWLSSKPESILASNVVYSRKATNNIPSFWTMGRVVSLKLRRDGFPKGAEDEYRNPGKSSDKKQIVGGAARDLVKLFSTKDSTLRKVENFVKSIEDVKTDTEFNSEFESRIELLLDRRSTCKRSCFQSLSSDQRQTVYEDVLSGS